MATVEEIRARGASAAEIKEALAITGSGSILQQKPADISVAAIMEALPHFSLKDAEARFKERQLDVEMLTGRLEGLRGDIETRELATRMALPAEGESRLTGSFTSGGVDIFPEFGQRFELFEGGGVRPVAARDLTPEEIAADKAREKTTLFDQPGEGVREEGITLAAPEGKTVVQSGQTIKNPSTGVDEEAKPGHILIVFDDGTVEERAVETIQTPGEGVPIGEFGRTPEELGITRRTEIKGGAGQEVTRAPFTAREALEQAETPEAKDKVLTDEGLASTSEFEFIGKTYQNRTAEPGMAFFQNIATRDIVQRPEVLESLAKPSTSPTVLIERDDKAAMFQAVFGRQPNDEELRYWQGRTDKSGSALIGAMQFAKQEGLTIGGQSGVAAEDPVEALKTSANVSQDKLAGIYTEAGVTTSSDEKAAIRAEIDALKTPEVESLKQFTEEQLATNQFQEATNDLNTAKANLRQMDTDYLSNLADLDRERLPMTVIRRNQTELDIAYNRARRDLVAEVNARSDIVQSQSAIMGMMIDAFKFDTQQAQVEYTNRFNKAMSMYNLVATEERDAFNIQQKLQDNQRANLAVMTGMLAEGTISYDQLTPEAKAQIESMEQATGLVGVSRAIGKTPMPPVVSIGSPITAADGGVHTPIYSQDPRTGEVSVTNYTSPFKAKVTGTGTGGIDIGSLLNGVLGQDSDWEVATVEASLEAPPMSGVPGTKMEWPNASGIIWEADNRGNWT